MAYQLKPGQSIESEVRRLADKQLTLAIASMRAIGDPKSDKDIHEARRHVKKIRALIRLVQTSLGRSYRSSNRRLRFVSRLLSPIADGEAVVDTLARFGKRYQRELPRRTLLSMRKGLVQRWAHIDQKAKAEQVLQKAVALLQTERKRVQSWQLDAAGFRAIARGLMRSGRDARCAMDLALGYPTADHYHSWRRHVKDDWFQVRLLERRCANRLIADERALEVLDECLGEHHNCVLLQTTLIRDALLPRHETAQTLRVLRRYQAELRREARQLGSQVYRETARQFTKRVRRAWRFAKDRLRRARSGTHARSPWTRAA